MHAHLQFVMYTRDHFDNSPKDHVASSIIKSTFEPRRKKNNNVISEQERQKLACTVTDTG